jgi:hypothetical protein
LVSGDGSTVGEASDTDQEASMSVVKAAMLEDMVLEDAVLEGPMLTVATVKVPC